jgi:L-lactate utilization protein LutC
MASAREQILSKLPGAQPPSDSWREPFAPISTLLPADRRRTLFAEKLAQNKATFSEILARKSIPGAVARHVARQGYDGKVIVGQSLTALPWDIVDLDCNGVSEQHDLPLEDGLMMVTDCFAAAAETGTIITLSDRDHDSRLNFVARHHCVVLDEQDLVGPYEDVWVHMQNRQVPMPRAANFITGPSRTADIEQTIELGAHGPASLHVILVRAPSSRVEPGEKR